MCPTSSACLLPATAPRALEWAAAALIRGEVIAFPTDTVYAVGAHALLPDAVARLFVAKERPSAQAIPLLLPGTDAMAAVCDPIPDVAWVLARRFWPGPLSIILPRTSSVPDVVTAGGATVAVRVPDHSLVLALCQLLAAPVAATSANRHGQPALTTAPEVMASLGDRLALVLDGGPAPGGIPSTVLDLTVSPPAILRAGPVTTADLAPYLGSLSAGR